MARRSGKSQSAHDAEVAQIAEKLKRQGYDVTADLKGYRRPDTVGGYRPDVVGKKGWKREIIEVETPESVDSARDRGQQSAFKQAANRSKHTTFRRKVTKK